MTTLFNTLALLATASVSAISFANTTYKPAYIDKNGYCVVDIHPSHKVKYVQQHVINVPSRNHHVIRIFETARTITNQPLCNGDSLVSSQGYIMTDYIDHDGRAEGYVVFTTKKGDKIVIKYHGNSQMQDAEELAAHYGTGRIIDSTGSLAGAEGDMQANSRFNRKTATLNSQRSILRYKVRAKDAKK